MKLLVVGSGLAGATAALSARSAEAEVTLVGRAPGATALCLGLLEVARGGLGATAAARALAELRPGHPYASLRGALDRMDEALAFGNEALGGPWVATPSGGRYIDPLGSLHDAPFALASQARGALVPGVRVGVASFRGQPAWLDGELVAGSLREAGIAAEDCPLDLVLREDRLSASLFAVAAAFDDPAEATRLGQSIARARKPDWTLVLLPAMIGGGGPLCGPTGGAFQLDRPGGALDRVAAEAGVACGELLAATPSVPGLRLQRLLERALADSGVTVVRGEIARLEQGQAILAGGQRLEFDRAVLATGRYLGGGVRRDDRFVEPLVGLPLTEGLEPLDGAPIESYLGEGPGAPGAAFRAGVRIDERLRPLDLEGRPLPWLHAAGAVLGGADPAVDGAGLGLAVFTGFLAGRFAVDGAGC